MKKYEVKIPMCLIGNVKAKNEDEAKEIAHQSFDVKNTTCEYWDIVETEVKEKDE